MQSRVVNYNEIVTKYNDEKFIHGEVVYTHMPKRDDIELYSVNVNAGLAILEDDEEEFTKELNGLFQRFAK